MRGRGRAAAARFISASEVPPGKSRPADDNARTHARVPDGANPSGLRELADREGFLVAFPDAETRFAGTLAGLLGG